MLLSGFTTGKDVGLRNGCAGNHYGGNLVLCLESCDAVAATADKSTEAAASFSRLNGKMD